MLEKWFTVKNEADSTVAEITIYDKIGKDYFGDDGIAAKDFNAALKDIPQDREIACRINSVGGNVWDGMAIYSMLNSRKDHVTCYVDGVAASIASVIAMAGKKTIMPKNALMMIHPPQALAMGDSDEMRKIADKLDAHAKAIASVYADKTGMSQEKCLAMMSKETWMSGEDAKKEGFCDETTDEPAMTAQAKDFDFSKFKSLPEILRNAVTNPVPQGTKNKERIIMNREEMIALLKARGVTVANDVTDEWLKEQIKKLGEAPTSAAPANPNGNPSITALEQKVANINKQLEQQAKDGITAIINQLVSECRVTAAEAPKAIVRAIADPSYIDELRGRPQMLPGSAPVDNGLMVVAEDAREIFKGIKKHIVEGPNAIVTAVERSKAIGAIYTKERKRVGEVMNAAANTIDASLKRVLILNEIIRDFATRVLPLSLFASRFDNVPLQGTDQVVVPYYPLQMAASSDFNVATGYAFDQATNTSQKTITVNKRKYQPLDYSSQEFRRQPWFSSVQLGKLNAEKLAVDVIKDILSVVTLANFGAAAKNIPVAGWTSDDVVDLKGIGTKANWPDAGRALIIDSDVEVTLSKDSAYKLALNIGTSEVIQQGKFPMLSGFSEASMPNFPANGENLVGFACLGQSAIGVATAPVDPAAGVRTLLNAYEIATDPATGISLNYRHWGDPTKDRDFEVIECAYGYAPLIAAALLRLTKP